jgi:hypothetical protein
VLWRSPLAAAPAGFERPPPRWRPLGAQRKVGASPLGRESSGSRKFYTSAVGIGFARDRAARRRRSSCRSRAPAAISGWSIGHEALLADRLEEVDVGEEVVLADDHARSASRSRARPSRGSRSSSRGCGLRAIGAPPRCVWPSTVVRVSIPVRSEISVATRFPMPPKRIGIGARRVVAADHLRVRRPAARPRRRPRSRIPGPRMRRSMSSATLRRSKGISGRRITSEPLATPAVQRDPAAFAAHAPRTPCTRWWLSAVECRLVERLGGGRDGGQEAEGDLGADEVVVDRLRARR